MAFASEITPTRSFKDSLIWRLFTSGSERAKFARRVLRYGMVFSLWTLLIWSPIVTYLSTVAPSFSSYSSLILPGAGVSASVNMDGIGQASSYASSAFASNSISPTQTYKRLIRAERILEAAAFELGIDRKALPTPKVTLVDQTGLIHLEMVGGSPEEAQSRGKAILRAFFTELEHLRNDDQLVREASAVSAIEEYRKSVQQTRDAVNALQNETGFLSKDQFQRQVSENDSRFAVLIETRAKLDERTAYVRALERSLGVSAQTAARALELYSDREYLALIQDASAKSTLLAQARSSYGTAHPKLKKAEADYAQAKKAALLQAARVTGLPLDAARRLNLSQYGDRTAILADLVRNEAERAGIEAQHATLHRRHLREKARLERAAQAAATLEDLQRDFQVAEAVFASAIARAQSTKVDTFGSYPLVQVLENPSLPKDPSSPRKKLAIAAGLGGTFLMTVALTLGWVRKSLIAWLIGIRRNG